MPYYEWRGSPEHYELAAILARHNVGQDEGDYGSLREVRDDFADFPPEDWTDVHLTVHKDREWTLSIDGEVWDIGYNSEFQDIYGWLRDMDVNFIKEYD